MKNNMSSVDKQPEAGLVERLKPLVKAAKAAIKDVGHDPEQVWVDCAKVQIFEEMVTPEIVIEAASAIQTLTEERDSAYRAGLETGRMEGAIIKAELEAAETALVEARKVLRPFAAFYEHRLKLLGRPDSRQVNGQSYSGPTTRVGDFRRAALLQSEAGKLGSSVAGLPSSRDGSDTQDIRQAGKED